MVLNTLFIKNSYKNVRFYASSSESIVNIINESFYNIDYFVKYRTRVYMDILVLVDKCVYKSDSMCYVYASVRFIDVMGFDVNYVYNVGQWIYKSNMQDYNKFLDKASVYNFVFSNKNSLEIYDYISMYNFVCSVYYSILLRIFCIYNNIEDINIVSRHQLYKVYNFFRYKRYRGSIIIYIKII